MLTVVSNFIYECVYTSIQSNNSNISNIDSLQPETKMNPLFED
jgi:hypothetical protein